MPEVIEGLLAGSSPHLSIDSGGSDDDARAITDNSGRRGCGVLTRSRIGRCFAVSSGRCPERERTVLVLRFFRLDDPNTDRRVAVGNLTDARVAAGQAHARLLDQLEAAAGLT